VKKLLTARALGELYLSDHLQIEASLQRHRVLTNEDLIRIEVEEFRATEL